MNKNTKVLLMAVVIILVALVSFNLNDLTGMVSSDITTLIVSPTVVNFEKYDAAKMITVGVSPSKPNGVNKKVEMYKCKNEKCTSSIKFGSETANICTDSTCYSKVTISYRLDSGLKTGTYYFQAEKDGKIFISNTFDIKHI